MGRALDLALGGTLLAATSPLLGVFTLAVWLQDRHDPIYRAPRVGRGGQPFSMLKLRSMTVNADRQGPSSTSATDRRVTPVGRLVRKLKLDELTQLINVVKGEMALVGPRPQVGWEVERYTALERGLLAARPGITDFASIVFSDEGDILAADGGDPDKAYERLIRPWKSELGLFYIAHRSAVLDVALVGLTAFALVSKGAARAGVAAILQRLGARAPLIEVARRRAPLRPAAVPGVLSSVATPFGA
jgi:lipopolysaccharide/colanic/teichoic acid biosynthesis glycosyltransferase